MNILQEKIQKSWLLVINDGLLYSSEIFQEKSSVKPYSGKIIESTPAVKFSPSSLS